MPQPPRSTLFPYTTLFRSAGLANSIQGLGRVMRVDLPSREVRGRLPKRHGYLVDHNGAIHHVVVAAPANVLKRHARKYAEGEDRKSTRLNSSHVSISYAVF